MRPQLKRNLILRIDLERTLDRYIAVFGLGRVIQLAVSCVPRSCVVPSARTFMGNVIQTLQHDNFQGRVQLPEHYAEGGAHDTTSDQHYVCLFSDHWFFILASIEPFAPSRFKKRSDRREQVARKVALTWASRFNEREIIPVFTKI